MLTFVPGRLAVKGRSGHGCGRDPCAGDGRGNGTGWTLKVNSASPARVMGITARCAASSTCTLPAAGSMPSRNVVLRAARSSGMGVMNLAVSLAAQSGSTPVSFAVS